MTKPDFEKTADDLWENCPSDPMPPDIIKALRAAYADGDNQGFNRGLERAAEIAQSVRAPASIGRDHGRHHEAGAQSAARLIRAEKEKTDGTA